ncbi:MAG: ATP-binding protein, partial [Euryarchaeota archaeon]|nr:ATP-binding protein [Euryarchaeota archaeon]
MPLEPKIRNRVIARVFRELDLIEQWGSGVRRMFKEAEALGLPEPEIIEVGMRVRFIVYLEEAIAVETTDSVTDDIQSRPESQLEVLLGSRLAARVFILLMKNDAGKSELAT